ncbi:MAG: helix-turn-helix domain-containing protein [Anaerolineae bacterium]|nr:helix-turn-helix domain-containing protein [Anaerolineae bacterium]
MPPGIVAKNKTTNYTMSITEQINILFDMHARQDGERYSMGDISEATGMSTGTISRLRSGDIENPSLFTLQKLCDYFAVQLAYFDCQTPEECRAYVLNHQSLRYRLPTLNYLLEAEGLSKKDVRFVLEMVQYMKRAAQSPPLGE